MLKRTNYGEADRILNLLTPEGKKSAIARGVRKEKSKLAGAIEPFSVSDIVLAEGKGEISTLVSARIEVYYENIIKDYDRLQLAYEVMKLVSKSSEMVDDPVWFSILNEVLSALNDFKCDLKLISTWFYLRYSGLEGHELNFSVDINGEPIVSDKNYWYDSSEKGLTVSDNGQITADHIKFMRLMLSKPIKTLAQVGGVEDILPVCERTAKEHTAIY